MRSYRPRHSDATPGVGSTLAGPFDRLDQFKTLGWYMMTAWVKLCPECGCYRGGTPGYYWHLIRENTDDEARIEDVHGGE